MDVSINPDLLSDLRYGLSLRIGKERAITSSKIIQELKVKRGYKNLTGATIRAHIHSLRTNERMFICGDSNGYYVPKNEIEATHQIKSLQSRIREMTEVAECLKESYRKKFSQTALFE